MPHEPEPRFEVPPEYAEVYERAYRRAYEQGLGVQQTSGTTLAPEAPRRGRRVAVPRQRGSAENEVQAPASGRGGARRADRTARPVVRSAEAPGDVESSDSAAAPPAVTRRTRRGHRGVPRTGSTWVPLLVLLALVLMLVAGAFVLGRATATGVGSLRSLGAAGVELR